MRNGMVKATTNRERKESRANILRHKDGERTKNEYVMFVSYKYQQCSDVYLWAASHMCVSVCIVTYC